MDATLQKQVSPPRVLYIHLENVSGHIKLLNALDNFSVAGLCREFIAIYSLTNFKKSLFWLVSTSPLHHNYHPTLLKAVTEKSCYFCFETPDCKSMQQYQTPDLYHWLPKNFIWISEKAEMDMIHQNKCCAGDQLFRTEGKPTLQNLHDKGSSLTNKSMSTLILLQAGIVQIHRWECNFSSLLLQDLIHIKKSNKILSILKICIQENLDNGAASHFQVYNIKCI